MPLFCTFNLQVTIGHTHLSNTKITHNFMTKGSRLAAAVLLLTIAFTARAQVNAVEFGKNRVQYQKFKWRYYQTENFNSYFSQDGLELGKYVAQVAEKNCRN